MKVLVTGGAGFIGSHIVDRLVEQGLEVVIVDNFSTGLERNVNPKAKVYRLDLRDPGLTEVFASERPECVSHHAAQVSVTFSLREPVRDAENNIVASINLLENCRRFGTKKIIYASTGGAIYGEPTYLPCDENHPINPLSPYGATKHAVEHYLHMYREVYGLDYTVLRYSNVYGPRQDPYGEAGVIAIFAGHMVAGEPVTINGSGEQERDFIYVSDVVAANLLAMEKGSGRLYNIACGVGTSVNEIFRRLAQISNYELPPNYGPAVPEVFKIYLDCQRAGRELGWRPSVTLDEGLQRTVEYFRALLASGKG